MASGLGGDFYDFIELPDGCQTLCIGDVTGHGLHASLVMAMLYGFIHHATQSQTDPLIFMSEVNDFLCKFARRSEKLDHFFSTTLFFGAIDPRSLRMQYANGGQVRPLVRRGAQIITLETTGPPLGFFDQPCIESKFFDFLPGDRLLLYTDGISEAVNSAGQFFGEDRVKQILLHSEGDHSVFMESAMASMIEFGCVNPPRDDCTAIVVDFSAHNFGGSP